MTPSIIVRALSVFALIGAFAAGVTGHSAAASTASVSPLSVAHPTSFMMGRPAPGQHIDPCGGRICVSVYAH